MNLSLFSKNNLDEVVFEHRNKQYGAYALRKSYDEHLLKAAASSFGLLFLFGSTFYIASLFTAKVVPIVKDKTICLDNNAIQPIIIVPDAFLSKQMSAPTTDNIGYRIVKDDLVNRTVPTAITPVQPLNPMGTGSSTVAGNPSGTLSGSVTTPTPAVVDAKPEFLTFVSTMPTFDGGEEAMANYVRSHFVFPADAMQYEKEGKVVVAFVVQTDGSITNVEVLKGFGFGSEEAARKLIQEMPKWIPGNQNGKLVPVQLVLPLQFQLR